jgi:hypothetical protein
MLVGVKCTCSACVTSGRWVGDDDLNEQDAVCRFCPSWEARLTSHTISFAENPTVTVNRHVDAGNIVQVGRLNEYYMVNVGKERLWEKVAYGSPVFDVEHMHNRTARNRLKLFFQ